MAGARAALGLPPMSPRLNLSLVFTESQAHFAVQVLARFTGEVHTCVQDQCGVPFWGKALALAVWDTDLRVCS